MFDPEMVLSDRLAKELGLDPNCAFYPKRECDEQELKYLVYGGNSVYDRIRQAIHAQANRVVDTTEWTRNNFALITLNFDTQDQLLARNGYSLRVRFALTKDADGFNIQSIDMCIKTIMPTGNNVVMFQQTRGEWECELHNLMPNMAKMIADNEGKEPPFPAFFKGGMIRDEDLFIESVGCSLRNVFPSYEIINRRNRIIVPAFQHTEDVKNIFLTPLGDILTAIDSEAEAEFLGAYGIDEESYCAEKFDVLMRKSMQLLDRNILLAAPGLIQHNLLSKAVRARNALEHVYGPDHGTVYTNQFNMQQRIEEASRFSLSQRITAKDISLEMLWAHVGHLRAAVEREKAPQGNPFQYEKNYS